MDFGLRLGFGSVVSISASAPVIADQSLPFGIKTLASEGDYPIVNTGAAIVSVSKNSGDPLNHWQMSSTGIVTPTVAGATAVLANGPYTFNYTVTSASGETDSATFTSTPIANARSVAPSTSETQLKTATEGALTRGTDKILLRSGTYNNAQADLRTKRTTAMSGSSGYAIIEPHTGATPVIRKWKFDGFIQAAGWFHIRGIDFYGTSDGSNGGVGTSLLSGSNGITDIKITGCTFHNDPVTGLNGTDITGGVRFAGLDRIIVEDNTFDYVFNPVVLYGIDCSIQRNVMTNSFNDAIKGGGVALNMVVADNIADTLHTPYSVVNVTNITQAAQAVVTVDDATGINVSDNMIIVNAGGMTEINLLISDITSVSGNNVTLNLNSTGFSTYTSGGTAEYSGIHPDLLQFAMGSTTTGQADNLKILRNILDIGVNGTRWNGGGGIFVSDSTVPVNNLIIEANLVRNGSSNGIVFTQGKDGRVKNNTCIRSLLQATVASNILAEASTTGMTIVNNVANGINNAGTNNIVSDNTTVATNQTAYESEFVNPLQTPVDFVSEFAVKTGINGSAGSGRVDFTNDTDTIPPWVSSVSGTSTAATTADGNATTDVSNGTLYWVVTQSTTSPSSAQIKAGQDELGASADASGNKTVSAIGVQSFSITGLVTSTTYYVYAAHEDSSSNISEAQGSASFSDGPVTHTQNFVDNGGAAYHTFGSNADSATATFSYWLNFNSVTGTTRFFEILSRTRLDIIGGKLRVLIRDTIGAVVYDETSTAVIFTTGTLYHIEIAVNLGTPEIRIRVDNSDVTMTAGSITAGSGLIDFTRTTSSIMADTGGTIPVDAKVSDIYIEKAFLAAGTLWNGGAPFDLVGLGSPIVLLADDMTADERSGDTSQGWNDSYNIGSLTVTSVGTYTDV